uniref:Semaphorin 4A n=1 Tax=Leptobrachium leishanense TaxID=445787 RepID=A0A8C5QJK6_9ANUR
MPWRPLSMFLLVTTLSCVLAEPMPRITFQRGDPGRSVKIFNHEGIRHYDRFLLSEDQQKLYVGAQDYVLHFSIDNAGTLEFKKHIHWPSDQKIISNCVSKAKSNETECLNFNRVLLPINNTHLYTCGTNAFSPVCTYINLETFSMYESDDGQIITFDGRGQSPFDPQHNNTAVMVDGEIYTGTMYNFKGNEPIIFRNLGTKTPLKTETSLGWLHPDASFVGSFNLAGTPAESKVYFFFQETAREFDFFEKLTVSRVARVCKNDAGGDKVLQKKWTTFLKAQLLCSHPDGFPFNVLQHVAILHPEDPERSIFYGVFSSQWQAGGSSSSAVCSFRLKEIERVFDGNYKEQNKESLRWTANTGQVPNPRPGSCVPGKFSDTDLNFMKDHFLMDEKVSPPDQFPLLIKQGLRYTRIAIDSVPTDSGNYTVMFLGTEKGSLQKVVVVNDKSFHIIEEMELLPNQEPVQNLFLASSKRMLYVGYSAGIQHVPLANCSVYTSCFECVLARDPYCAWDVQSRMCRWAQSKSNTLTYWLQDIENGNPNSTCLTSPPKGRTPASANETNPMTVANYTAKYNTILKLKCPQRSTLASYTWRHPLLKSSEKQIVTSQDTLVIIVRGDTLGLYECWATENGFTYQVAKYWVKDPSGVEVTHRDSQNMDDSNMDTSLYGNGHSYYTHFVVVSILLVSTLFAILCFVLYNWRDKLKAKTKIQGCSTPETEKLSDTTRLNGICHSNRNIPRVCCVPMSGADSTMDVDNNTVKLRTPNGVAAEDVSDV